MMEWWMILLLVLAALLLLVVIPLLFVYKKTNRIAKGIYEEWLVRTTPDKWGRECSCLENEEHVFMFHEGLAWGKQHEIRRKEVCIQSYDGLKLCGEYFDFGADKAVIILPGRAESLLYSYYFAPPFEKAGYNILVVDVRAHGFSEGRYGCLGLKEYRDTRDWAKFLHETLGNRSVVLYGLCIGGATAVYAVTKPGFENYPYISGIVTEGVYTSFYEVLKQRTRTNGKPTFPVVPEICAMIRRDSGINVRTDGPEKWIRNVQVPALFLCGKADISSLPKKMQWMFDLCGSEQKQIVWYDKGAHSHLRVNNLEDYDNAICRFLEETVESKHKTQNYPEKHAE